MTRILPLVLLLVACGDDPETAVATDTAVVAVDPAAETAPDPLAEPAAETTPAPDGAPAAPVHASDEAAPPEPGNAESTADEIPPALAALPGETLYYKDGAEETVQFTPGATATSGTFTYRPHPDIDAITGDWSIEGNTLTFNGTAYAFDGDDGAGTYRFVSPQGDMVLTVAAG